VVVERLWNHFHVPLAIGWLMWNFKLAWGRRAVFEFWMKAKILLIKQILDDKYLCA